MAHPYLMDRHIYYNFYYIAPQKSLNLKQEEEELNQWLFNLKGENREQEILSYLASFVQQSGQPFLSVYPNGDLILSNQAFLDLTGYREEDLYAMEVDRELTPPLYRELDQERRIILNNHHQPQCYAKEYLHKEGYKIPVEILIHRSFYKGQEYYYAFITDITQRMKISESIGLLAHAVDQSPNAISIMHIEGKIIYVISHYTKISGYTKKEVIGERSPFMENTYSFI